MLWPVHVGGAICRCGNASLPSRPTVRRINARHVVRRQAILLHPRRTAIGRTIDATGVITAPAIRGVRTRNVVEEGHSWYQAYYRPGASVGSGHDIAVKVRRPAICRAGQAEDSEHPARGIGRHRLCGPIDPTVSRRCDEVVARVVRAGRTHSPAIRSGGTGDSLKGGETSRWLGGGGRR
jgi:hypothetical protein